MDQTSSKWFSTFPNTLSQQELFEQVEKERHNLFAIQDKWVTKDKHPRTISMHDPEHSGRQQIIRVDGKGIKVRGKVPNKITNIAWVDPMYVAKQSWTFVIPFDILGRTAGD